jgi:hypothetical protein
VIRRTPLRRSRKPLKANAWHASHGRPNTSQEDRAKLKAERARVTGAEYRSIYLAGVFKATGCDLCGRYRPPAQQHHVRSGGKGRRADASETVILCGDCHRKGHDRGFVALLAAHGLPPDHLDLRAAEHATSAQALGYLPTELCDECGSWHSRKFMLWEIDGRRADPQPREFQAGSPLARIISPSGARRICTACAPEGPP